MKVLRFAIFSLVIFWTGGVSGGDDLYDFEQLTTQNGKVYRSIFVLDSDKHGLFFRHDAGIAKIDFEQLSMSLRMLYEPVATPPVEPLPAKVDDADADAGKSASVPPGGSPWIRGANLTLTARNRVAVVRRGYGAFCLTPGAALRDSRPLHWPRYQPALRLAIPVYRAAVVDDFLITTGLVPRPPGVRPYRLSYNRPDLLY